MFVVVVVGGVLWGTALATYTVVVSLVAVLFVCWVNCCAQMALTLQSKQFKLYDDSVLLHKGNTLGRKDTLPSVDLLPKYLQKKGKRNKQLPVYLTQMRLNFEFFSERFLYRAGVGDLMLAALNNASEYVKPLLYMLVVLVV